MNGVCHRCVAENAGRAGAAALVKIRDPASIVALGFFGFLAYHVLKPRLGPDEPCATHAKKDAFYEDVKKQIPFQATLPPAEDTDRETFRKWLKEGIGEEIEVELKAKPE